jgi:hypothetical protein
MRSKKILKADVWFLVKGFEVQWQEFVSSWILQVWSTKWTARKWANSPAGQVNKFEEM